MKNNSVTTRYGFFLFVSLFLFMGNKLLAQENGIYEIVQSNMQLKKTDNKDQSSNRSDFYDLAFKLYPTAYVENNSFKYYDPNKIISKLNFNDSQSLGLLYQNNSKFDKVELLIITLKTHNELNNTINLIGLKRLNNLKYIFIKCHFKCSENQIKKFITAPKNVRVFYSVENPS